MRRRPRLLLIPILAVALPLVALAAIGYLWLTLDRDAAARRLARLAPQLRRARFQPVAANRHA